MNALRRLVRCGILSLAVIGIALFISGPISTVLGEVEGMGERVTIGDAAVRVPNVVPEVRPSDEKAATTCLKGYVHYWGEEYGYEVFIGDNFATGVGCGIAYESAVEYITWEIVGDVGEPNPCAGGRWDCGTAGAEYVTGGCDDEAVFYVWYLDDEFEWLDFQEIDITYQYGSCSGS
jgi:hypothetical protein